MHLAKEAEDYEHNHGNRLMQPIVALSVRVYEPEDHIRGKAYTKEPGADEKPCKVGIVPLTDTIADEWAVVIEAQHAIVAVPAMRRSGRADDLTSFAPFVPIVDLLLRQRRHGAIHLEVHLWHAGACCDRSFKPGNRTLQRKTRDDARV